MTDSAARGVLHRYEACGVPITAASIDDVLHVLRQSQWGQSRTVHFCNTYTLALASADSELQEMLAAASMNLPDGWPISLIGGALRVEGHSGQVPGPDVLVAALDDEEVGAKRHALFGGSPEVLAILEQAIARDHPNAHVVASHSPPFGELDAVLTDAAIQPVLDAKPDIVWVALGTPLQDQFLGAAHARIPATMLAVGAAFDFLAGTLPRAPVRLRRMRLEWAWRLVHEPRRLWRRYLFGSARFLWSVAVRRPTRLPPRP